MSIQEEDAAVDGFISRYQLSYPFLMDRDGGTSVAYGVRSTPTTYFISPDGLITDVLAGVVSRSWLEDNINDFVGA